MNCERLDERPWKRVRFEHVASSESYSTHHHYQNHFDHAYTEKSYASQKSDSNHHAWTHTQTSFSQTTTETPFDQESFVDAVPRPYTSISRPSERGHRFHDYQDSLSNDVADQVCFGMVRRQL